MVKTKKFLGMGALVIAVFAVALLTAGVASAQEPTPPVPRGPHGTGMMSTYHADLHAATAEALGLTVEELDAELDAGKTLVQIAGEQGVDLEDVLAAREAARADIVAQLVADGKITQAQADWMLERMEARAAAGYGAGNCMGARQGMRGQGGYGQQFGRGMGQKMGQGFGRGAGMGRGGQ